MEETKKYIKAEPPSWETCARIWCAAVEHGTENLTSRAAAREELIRMGALLDKFEKQLNGDSNGN